MHGLTVRTPKRLVNIGCVLATHRQHREKISIPASMVGEWLPWLRPEEIRFDDRIGVGGPARSCHYGRSGRPGEPTVHGAAFRRSYPVELAGDTDA